MNNLLLKKNLSALKKLDSTLYEQIEPLKGSTNYEVTSSKSGLPSLIRIDSQGNKRQIHSNYDPRSEATRYLKAVKASESMNCIVLGFGLGYQAIELIRNASSLDKFYIFENDPELFALAIREIDLTEVLEHPGVQLFINVKPTMIGPLLDAEQVNFTLNQYCVVRQVAIIEGALEYYGVLLDEITKYFKESEINFKTQSTHSKIYNKNIFSNFDALLESPGIKSLKDSLCNVPAIICSAGPSLDKNIHLLKSARKRFFLIAVATALKPLRYHGIQPDAVISIDPDELTINSFELNEVADFWFVYNPAVPGILPKTFYKRRLIFDSEVYLAKWFKKYTEEKGSLGKISSVAHSAVMFSQYLGCSHIILVGQDLSFCKQRQHCLHSFYHEKNMDKVSRLNPLSYWDHKKFKNFIPNMIQSLDLFGKSIVSTIAMESYNHIFSKNFSNSDQLINATEGGMPIQGAQNLSLREALYKCDVLLEDAKDRLVINDLPSRNTYNTLKSSILIQIKLLEDISGKLKSLESKNYHSNSPSYEDKQLFIAEMKIVNGIFLKNKETALLLQGYDFAGFSNWYRSNSEILRKKELSGNADPLDEEFDRDLQFFEVLSKSVEYLKANFEKILPL